MPLPVAAYGVVLAAAGALGPRVLAEHRRRRLERGRAILRDRGWTPVEPAATAIAPGERRRSGEVQGARRDAGLEDAWHPPGRPDIVVGWWSDREDDRSQPARWGFVCATAPCGLPFDLLLRNVHLSAGVRSQGGVGTPFTVESDVVNRRWDITADTDRLTALRYLDARAQEVLADDRFEALHVQVRDGRLAVFGVGPTTTDRELPRRLRVYGSVAGRIAALVDQWG